MDPALRDIWSVVQNQPADRSDPEESATEAAHSDPSPESLLDLAYVLSSAGERREAADTLRRAVGLAESIEAAPSRVIPLLEALAEVLWQLGEKLEARLFANRAIKLWFSLQPKSTFELSEETKSAS